MASGASHVPGADTVSVLHVDDDTSFLDLASTFLERHDVDVTTATSATAGLDVLAEADIDCVVSDYDMPAMTGIEFLEAVRDDYPDLPFVLFTGKGSEEIAADAISAGVTDYLQKDTGTDQYAVLANRVQNAVESVRAEHAAERRQDRLETLSSALPDVAFFIDETGRYLEAYAGKAERLAAVEAGELVGQTLHDVFEDDIADRFLAAVQRAIDTGSLQTIEYDLSLEDGAHWFEARVGPADVPTDGNDVAVWVARDITDRKHREQELRRTNARLEALFEQSPDMINIHDSGGSIVDANRRFCEELGYDQSELDSLRVWDIDADATPEGLAEMRANTEPGELQRFEATYQRRDGSTFPVEAHLTRLDRDGEESYLVFSRDVTDAVARTRELQRVRGRSETVFEHAEDALFLIDVTDSGDDVRFEYAASNPRHSEIIGVSQSDLRGQTPEAVFGADLAADLTALYRECYDARETITHETVVQFPSGETAISVNLSPVVVDDDVVQIVGIGRDVTERRERERELRRERDRLDEFAGILSHDLRNPLSVAEGNLELARETGDLDRLDDVADAHDRMRTLIEDILTLAREGKPVTEFESVALADVVTACWGTSHDATLDVQTEARIAADESRLQQVLENLLRNAIEHGGEDVTVEVGDLDDGFYVADDGPGIPESEREDVFRTGVTESEDGTGFGLAIVREIVDAHGWRIDLGESERGGARIEIRGVDRHQ